MIRPLCAFAIGLVVWGVLLASRIAMGEEAAAWSTPASFAGDVVPLLTRLGCNQGACHGKNDGRNGFKLSLRGYAPELDIERLTNESRGRRLNVAAPDSSLILRKATGQTPHGGGAILTEGTREYRLLRDWIAAGAPGPLRLEPRPKQLTITPGPLHLAPGGEQAMKVEALYTDGRVRDVTWLATFYTGDASQATISPEGKLTMVRQGETSVRAHFDGLIAITLVTSPRPTPVDPARLARRNNVIDEHVLAKLAALGIPPSDDCGDAAFLRRVSLDLVGTLPTPEEIARFAADARPDKRARLVDDLLARPEWVEYWALQLGDLLQNRRERDHDVRGPKGVRAMHDWIRQQLLALRPWDEIARTVLTASGSAAENPAVGYYIVTVGEKNNGDESEVVASVAQTFLGTRIGCAQCHNHPLERYTQDDYYHFAGFFSTVKFQRKEWKDGVTQLGQREMRPDERIGVGQPRTHEFLTPRTLDGLACDIGPGADPRVALADWVVHPANEYFAAAMVNRLWKHFLGVGLVEPVDDLRGTNPPTNPELMAALRREFTEHRFDLAHLMRLIVNSRTYQLSAQTLKENQSDDRYYSHYYARRLPAEVLLDAISQATEAPEPFAGYPLGVRAIQLPEPGVDSYFLKQFGRSDRVTACACERRGEVNLPQLLQLLNGENIARKFTAPAGRLARLAALPGDRQAAVHELYLATLSRPPRPEELQAMQNLLAQSDKPEEGLVDILWTLLNTKEFCFNH